MANQNIPLLDLSPQTEALWSDLMVAVQEVIRGGHFILGPNVKAFEQEVSEYLGVRHAVGVNSGTDALVIGLRAAGIGPGDEVITTPFSFYATAEAISHLGAKPVFVDIEPDTFNMDASLIEAAITERTGAILPAHIFGQSVDLGAVLALADRYDLLVVEDVAQAFGAVYQGQKLGTLGAVGCFSFFPSKPLGAFGDGGMIVTDDDGIADTARMLRAHGARKKYYNQVLGYNSRLDELQAAILRVKLPHVDAWGQGRHAAAQRYNRMLAGMPGIVTPTERGWGKHVYHQYTVRIREGKRDVVQQSLAEAGIGTMVYYPVAIHRLPVYEGLYGRLPEAELAANEVLSLPIWPQISEETQRRVVEAISICL